MDCIVIGGVVFIYFFHIKLYVKWGGLNRPYFSYSLIPVLFSPLSLSHFLDWSFCFQTQRCRFLFFVPHHRFLSWPCCCWGCSEKEGSPRIFSGGVWALSLSAFIARSDTCLNILPSCSSFSHLCRPCTGWLADLSTILTDLPCLGRAAPKLGRKIVELAQSSSPHTPNPSPASLEMFQKALKQSNDCFSSSFPFFLVLLLLCYVQVPFIPDSEMLPFSRRKHLSWWVG